MKTRIISSVVGIIVFLSIIALSIFVRREIICIALVFLSIIVEYEGLNALDLLRHRAISMPCFGFALAVTVAPLFPEYCFNIVIISLILLGIVVFSFMLTLSETLSIERMCTGLVVTCLIVLPIFASSCIYFYDEDPMRGLIMFLYCIVAAWLTDAGAYFIGTWLGKHQMAPKISPKKTIEGALGGLFSSVILIWAVAFLCGSVFNILPYEVNYRNLLVITFICSIISMIGDLSFSLIKRTCNVKDFGNIMPGHGGLLDRFDSVLFVWPVAYVLNSFLPILGSIN